MAYQNPPDKIPRRSKSPGSARLDQAVTNTKHKLPNTVTLTLTGLTDGTPTWRLAIASLPPGVTLARLVRPREALVWSGIPAIAASATVMLGRFWPDDFIGEKIIINF